MLSILDDISAIHRFYRISACLKDAEVYYNKITEEEEDEDGGDDEDSNGY